MKRLLTLSLMLLLLVSLPAALRAGGDCEFDDVNMQDQCAPSEGQDDGYDAGGYDDEGYDRQGYDRHGYDDEGYDRAGYDRAGYDREGYDRCGYDRDGFDREGYDCHGRDRQGNDGPDDGKDGGCDDGKEDDCDDEWDDGQDDDGDDEEEAPVCEFPPYEPPKVEWPEWPEPGKPDVPPPSVFDPQPGQQDQGHCDQNWLPIPDPNERRWNRPRRHRPWWSRHIWRPRRRFILVYRPWQSWNRPCRPAPSPVVVKDEKEAVTIPEPQVQDQASDEAKPVEIPEASQDQAWVPSQGEPTPVTRGETANFHYWQENYRLDGSTWIDHSYESYFTPDPSGVVYMD